MHRIWIGMALLLCASLAFGQSSELVPVWNVNQDGTLGTQTLLAKAWHGTTWDTYCNRDWCIDVSVTAEVAQWMSIYLEGRNIWWRVLKPGDYATDGIAARITSNGDVCLGFNFFDDLFNDEGDRIEAFWGYATGGAQPGQAGFGGWYAAPGLNDQIVTVPEDQSHQPISFTLWNRILVIPCDSACQYSNEATICVRACEQKPWVDTETGYFDPDYPIPTFPEGDLFTRIDPILP